MQDFIQNFVQPHFNYWAYVIVMMIGFWALIAKRNLIKKLIGMSIFQSAIILFYVSLGVKDGATIPIIDHHQPAPIHEVSQEGHDAHYNSHGEEEAHHHKPVAAEFVNPLPHVLMLTAIVVGVATLGVALAVSQSIYKDFGTLEEHEILEQIKTGDFHD
ncbi:MAG: cation:proton antiporter subunit C [Verrucomicrobiales bacterium]|nr:cation:proton antiporter subunit C [Verrucomicrobiales bacterium]